MENYINSDLAVECKGVLGAAEDERSYYSEEEKNGCTICRLDILTEEISTKYGKGLGNYVTVFCEKMWLMDSSALYSLSETISDEIKHMLDTVVPEKNKRKWSVLVAGLGNLEITADAIGPLAVRQITVTRHVQDLCVKMFDKKNICNVSAIAPGVLAQTGIETVEMIKSAVDNVKPDVVIAIDALAARNCERLGTTVQLSNSGISPGSGIGNMRKSINKENLGVPVIALGVPTVVDSSTLVYDALQKAGISEIDDELKKVLENGRGFFVSPKESDMITKSVSEMLATALDIAFGIRA